MLKFFFCIQMINSDVFFSIGKSALWSVNQSQPSICAVNNEVTGLIFFIWECSLWKKNFKTFQLRLTNFHPIYWMNNESVIKFKSITTIDVVQAYLDWPNKFNLLFLICYYYREIEWKFQPPKTLVNIKHDPNSLRLE